MAIVPKKEKKILQKAQKFTLAKNWKKAIVQYRLLIAEKEGDQSLHNLLGDLLSKPEVNEKEEAINEFKRAAELYEHHGFLAQAIAVYKKILRLDPDNLEHNSNIAELFIKHGITHDASIQLQTVAQQYIKENKPDRAIAIYEKILKISDSNEIILKTLSDLYLQKSENAKASELFVKMWEIYQKKGEIAKGIDMITKAVELDIKNVPAIQILSNYYIKNKNYSEALSFLDSINAQEIDNITIKKCYGLACAKMDRVNDAIKILESVCSQKSDEIESKKELGILYLKTKNLEKAYNCFTVVGNNYYECRDFENYKILFETYIENDPNNVQALERLLHVYQILNDTEKSNQLEEKLKLITESSFQTGGQSPSDMPEQIEKEHSFQDMLEKDYSDVPEVELDMDVSDEGIELGIDLESLLDSDEKVRGDDALDHAFDLTSTQDFGEVDLSLDDHDTPPEIEFDLDKTDEREIPPEKSEDSLQVSIESELVKDDYATRYELGIAYKEMGLFEEAINEFEYASQNQELKINSKNMLGICFRELGKYPDAIKVFKEIITDRSLDNNTKAAIYFDLALTLELNSEFNESFENYSKVSSLNPDFPDIQNKMNKLKNLISKD